MKKLTILLLALFSFSVSWAQKITVHEESADLGKGKSNSLVTTIYGADPSDVQKGWKSIMKDYNAQKISTLKGDVMFADNTTIKDMGNNTIDIYTQFIADKDGSIKMIVQFDLGGAYLSSSAHADKYKIAEKIIHDFAVKMTADALNDKLKTEQKALDKLNSQEKDLEKDTKNQNSDINDYQAKIKKAQDAIEKDKDAEAKKQTEISNQQKAVDDLAKKVKEVQ